MNAHSYISNADPAYIDSLYRRFLQDPQSLDTGWRQFFQGVDYARRFDSIEASGRAAQTGDLDREFAVWRLIDAYRGRGHLVSDTNPIRPRKDRQAKLALSDFGLSEGNLDQPFSAGSSLNMQGASLQALLERLQAIYCGKTGYEYAHIESVEKRLWLQQRIESTAPDLSLDYKKRILHKLNGAVVFEKFLHTKYVGQKRFSLEGGECTIPALDFIIDRAVQSGTEEVIIGMAHRGRLNVLANIVGKTYDQIFSEFEGTSLPDLSFGSGDVKYHLGFSSQVDTPSGKRVQIKLAPNPSHLEAVDPVVLGLARAKADLLYGSEYDRILPILIHGDAALAGQGVVYEAMQMSHLDGYSTGGSIHFVINNQIGFTTDFDDARSSVYCTALANALQVPVFHVNGDDPEAVIRAVLLATDYRQHFNDDVFVDMVCYRRHGHNEGDDPKFTQPRMYQVIQSHPNVRELYGRQLASRGQIEAEMAKEMEQAYWNLLQERLDEVRQRPLPYLYQEPELAWRALKQQATPVLPATGTPQTGLPKDFLKGLFERTLETPPGFRVLPKLQKIFKGWQDLANSGQADWAMAEILAYASLLTEGKNIRLSGQDVMRGTFSHRHLVLFDEHSNAPYVRLANLQDGQGRCFVYNSLLSENAVLGFEYGYSLSSPDQLVLWEAQFGDFANGAQVVIDQFIVSAQSKWNRMSGMVLLLPHGYDGQGPEHSSARLERFLQACAESNLIVANVSTPANFFHLLRRQLALPYRRPLVVMSPKSLLRHPKCLSPFEEMDAGTQFQELIHDLPSGKGKTIRTVILCSGQVYYDLLARREATANSDTALVRVEQLYPFPKANILRLHKRFGNARWVWCQEEPANMGAAAFARSQLPEISELEWITRPESAASAVGHKKIHDEQLKVLLDRCFPQ
ncbi:MAG: 2-oxoglutarate dehydrogenase E1 component [Saprospiraceae bacterium]|jgi:2-oxoglutarate dehydrogenase E1 component|nr:2-oxoglutarate dehydrogenase E1 component [Saprospiraceae bacterium]MBP9210496.1 2-oxoglutarate dehydrogenase E1 component [Saprospiraceae bacterium]MBV6472594.1 2-oxoglutarate dehydrogenase E1 component [Saprospiraceae bacterium]